MTAQQPYFKPAFFLHLALAFVALAFLLAMALGYALPASWIAYTLASLLTLRLVAEFGYRFKKRQTDFAKAKSED
jgi:membrane protein implicated in regulation of membrane protease activity